MKLLKIGTLNIPRNRWMDALEIFEKIYVFCNITEKRIEDENIIYIPFNNKSIVNKFLLRIISKTEKEVRLNGVSRVLIFLLRNFNHKTIKEIKKLDVDYVHSSYNDFDESALLTIMIKTEIEDKIVTRAYKETRTHYRYLEKNAIELSDRVILNHPINKIFFEKKYGKSLFNGKKIVFNLDEDYRSKFVMNKLELQDKYSLTDGKKHVVILAGRVMSDSKDSRSGSRLYYIPMIREFVEKGFIVHLHCLNIVNDQNGVNQYEQLREQYPKNFVIEVPLDFEHSSIESYKILSKYDYGILHNFIEGTSNSEFDKVNIPHRYYEYQIAEVAPIVKKGNTKVFEEILLMTKSGIVYSELEELFDDINVQYFKPSFFDYISALYGNI